MISRQATLPLPNTTWLDRARKLRAWQDGLARQARPVILLAIRLLFGFGFVLAGWGKLGNLERITGFFSSLGIPLAEINAPFVAGLELVGGLLLIAGAATRIFSLPLLLTMAVALVSAHADELGALGSDPGTFIGAAPVPFMVALLVLLGFGPGSLSVDHWIARYLGRAGQEPISEEPSA